MLHVRKLDYFYSRPCGRGDVRGNLKIALVNISTHAPAGGATARASRLAVGAIFLLTPLREGRRGRMKRLRLFLLFLLTPLREGRRHTVASLSIIINFYSRPCGRGDKPIRYVFGDERISTHAPAGGATGLRGGVRIGLGRISTHAPAGGATREGRFDRVLLPISTHAPAGGATQSTANL